MGFSDKDNILRKAVDKVRKSVDENAPDFYDPEEDDDNENWVKINRFSLTSDTLSGS